MDTLHLRTPRQHGQQLNTWQNLQTLSVKYSRNFGLSHPTTQCDGFDLKFLLLFLTWFALQASCYENVAAPERPTCGIRRSFRDKKAVIVRKITLFLR